MLLFYNTIFPKPGRSWLPTELFYHTLKAINQFNLPLKFNLLTTEVYSHLQHSLVWVHFSGKLPHMLMSQPRFETYNEDSCLHNWVFAKFFTYHGKFLTYLIIFTPDKYYWSFSYHWQNFLTSMIKVKTQTRFMVPFHIQIIAHLGNLQVLCLVSPPGIYPYPPLTIDFSHLYRDCMMTEYAFFARKAERWGKGKDMMSLWGSLNICPYLNYLELLCHSSGELLSISSLKIWGDLQEPRNDIAYLLVCTGDALEAQNYGISLVWISPNQVWASTMEEPVGALSAYISSGPNWSYALAQLYEGSSHTPFPKDKH